MILQCAGDDDVAKYRCILRKWCSHIMKVPPPDSYMQTGFWNVYAALPYGRRYLLMSQIEHLHGDIAEGLDILSPASAFDTQEIIVWAQNLLWGIHGQVCQIDDEC